MHPLLIIGLVMLAGQTHTDTPPNRIPRREFRYGALPTGNLSAGQSAFSRDGRFVAVSGTGSRIGVFHTKLALLVNEFKGHQRSVSSVVSWPGRDTLVSGDMGGNLLLWRPQTGKYVGRMQLTGPVTHISPQPGGSQVAVLTQGHSAWLIDMETGRKKSLSTGFPGQVFSAISFNADGTQLAMGFKTGNVVVWNLTTQKLSELGVFKTAISDLTFRQDTLLIANGTTQIDRWLPTNPTALFQQVSSTAWSVLDAGKQGVFAGLATGEIVRIGSATVPEQVVCVAKSAVMNVAMHPVEPLVLATYAHAPAKTWVVR